MNMRNASCVRTQTSKVKAKIVSIQQIDFFHNDVKRGFQDDTRNLIGSAITKVFFKPIKFRLTSRFPRLTSL